MTNLHGIELQAERHRSRQREIISGLQPSRLISLELSDCLSTLHAIEASSNVSANTGLIFSPHKLLPNSIQEPSHFILLMWLKLRRLKDRYPK